MFKKRRQERQEKRREQRRYQEFLRTRTPEQLKYHYQQKAMKHNPTTSKKDRERADQLHRSLKQQHEYHRAAIKNLLRQLKERNEDQAREPHQPEGTSHAEGEL